MIKIKKYLILLILFVPFFPVFVFANSPENFSQLVDRFMGILKLIAPLLISLAILAFLIGVAMFIWRSDNETERSKGKDFMVWGVVGLFVMVSLWGLVNVLKHTFINDSSAGYYDSIPLNPLGGEVS